MDLSLSCQTESLLPSENRYLSNIDELRFTAGYVGNDKATTETLDSEGWLKTGDLCYFDSNGFLFIVDRLKEVIKYKGYQVI